MKSDTLNRIIIQFINNILVLYLILACGAIILGENETIIVSVFTLLVLFYLIIRKGKISVSRNSILFTVSLILIIMLSYVFNEREFSRGSINFIFGFILKIINAVLFVHCVDFDKFRKIYINQIVILAILSLVFFYSFKTGLRFINIIPFITETTNYTDYLVYINHVPAEYSGLRNFSIFYEPGVYQGLLNIAMMFIITSKSTPQVKAKFLGLSFQEFIIVVVLSVTVLTTFSTTGYIAMIVNFLILMLKKANNLVYLPIGITAIIIIILSQDFQRIVYAKLHDSDNSSTQRRLTGSLLDLDMSLEKPFFGYGYKFFKVKESHLVKSGIKEVWAGSTNSIFYHSAMFGIFFIFLILMMYGRFSFSVSNNYLQALLILLFFILILLGETFLQKMLFLVFGFYGLNQRLRYG